MSITDNSPAQWRLPPLKTADHKYTRGHAVVLGGATMTGASRLAAHAAQRAGAGLVTLVAPEAAWPVYAASLLSIIARPWEAAAWATLLADDRVTAILIGPGAGHTELTRHAIETALGSGKHLLLDADAITLLAKDSLLRKAVKAAILTPHEGEYAAIAAACGLDVQADKPTRALALAKALNSTVLLKGPETFIAAVDGRIARNANAPAWLATGGTGDVLSGIITGLLAQGMSPFDAACAGAWLQGEAAQHYGPGMVAEDLLTAIPAALAVAEQG